MSVAYVILDIAGVIGSGSTWFAVRFRIAGRFGRLISRWPVHRVTPEDAAAFANQFIGNSADLARRKSLKRVFEKWFSIGGLR
jgi:hypothetical protein